MISKGAKNLIRQMLTLNPKRRISAQDALSDPWITENKIQQGLKQNIIDNLTNFQSQNRFRHAVIIFMSNMVVSKKEQKELMEAFQALDLDGNGTLTYEELIEGYKKIYPKKTIEEVEIIVQNIMDKIDVNGSGQIDFSEFIVASMSQATLLHASSI